MTGFHLDIVRPAAALCAAAALVVAGAATATARPAGAPAIPLNNGQETTGADTGASGKFSYDIDGDQFCYTMSAKNLSVPAVAAHVHLAPRTVAGPIVIELSVGSGTAWTVSDCVTVAPDLLAQVAASPGSYYVNVHTPTFPGGEIRGQLK